MATISEMLAQKAELERQIAEAQRTERTQAINQIRTLMTEYGLTAADIGNAGSRAPRAARGPASGGKVAPKYRDSNGNTWSGRGLQPRWLRDALASGRKIDEFAI